MKATVRSGHRIAHKLRVGDNHEELSPVKDGSGGPRGRGATASVTFTARSAAITRMPRPLTPMPSSTGKA
jgi:hypothetical protein